MIDLTEIEKAKLQRFADDDLMHEAVKKLMLSELHDAETMASFAERFGNLPIEEIGKKLAIQWAALDLVRQAFNSVNQYKSPLREKGRSNQAR